MSRAPSRERWLRLTLVSGSLAAILSALAILEGALRIVDPGLMVRQRGLQRYHPRLGWENRPGARSAAMMRATRAMRSTSPTEVPPNFMTKRDIWRAISMACRDAIPA